MDKRKKGSEASLRTPSKTTPTGVAPVFSQAARFRRDTTDRLLNLFSLWGYREIILPSFEYLDAISPGIDPGLLTKLYLMQDRGSGQVLVLRPDATAQIARLTTQSFRDHQLPLRFCYSTSVFRDENHPASLHRELQQTGLELLGDSSVAADAEILELCLSGTKIFPLKNPLLVLSHAGFQEAILRLWTTDPSALRELRPVFHSRNPDRMLSMLPMPRKNSAKFISRMMEGTYSVRDARSELNSLRSEEGSALSEDLNRFLSLLESIDQSPHGKSIRVDFALTPPGPYYSGMFFQVYGEESPTHLASGGRYDRLGKSFGHEIPAVGFAYHITHIEEAIRKREMPQEKPVLVLACYRPDEYVAVEKFAQALRLEECPVMTAPDPSTMSGASLSPSEILSEHREIAAIVFFDPLKKQWALIGRKKTIRTASTLSEISAAILSGEIR